MLQEVLASLTAKGPDGPVELLLERTRLLRVAGTPPARDVQVVPLDQVDSVSYGTVARKTLWMALGLFGFVLGAGAGGLAYWFGYDLLVAVIGVFVGLALLLVGITATTRSGGERLRIRSATADWDLPFERARADEVTDFSERLLLARLAFLEGVYGEEMDQAVTMEEE